MAGNNVYNSATKLWTVDTPDTIIASGKTVVVVQVIYFPAAVGNDLVIQDAEGNDAIILKAGATDASPVRWPAEPGGRTFNGLKIATISAGIAYIYLAKR